MKQYELVEKKCAECGKIFIPTYNYAFKRVFKDHTYYFCKYTCMCRFREKHPGTYRRKFEGEKRKMPNAATLDIKGVNQ